MLVDGERIELNDPDLARFLGVGTLRKPFEYDGHIPIIDRNHCTGCGACLRRCPEQCIHKDGIYVCIDASSCRQCGKCIFLCPFGGVN